MLQLSGSLIARVFPGVQLTKQKPLLSTASQNTMDSSSFAVTPAATRPLGTTMTMQSNA